MNHFELRLMFSSQKSRIQNTQDGILVKVFQWEKKRNVDLNAKNLKRFLLGMSPDVPAFKAPVLTSDFKF